MAYIIKRSKNINTYTTESFGTYDSIYANDSNTISNMGEYEYYNCSINLQKTFNNI